MNRFKPGDKARVIGNENDIEASQYKLPPGRYLLISLNIGCGWHKNRKMFEGQVFVKGYGDNFRFETEQEGFDNNEGLYFYKPIVRPLQPIERNDEVIATQQAMPQGTEAGIPEPIEPVQEEERPAIEDYMVNLETAAAEYYASPNLFRYTQAVDNYVDNLLDTISRLKSEIEELKRKA